MPHAAPPENRKTLPWSLTILSWRAHRSLTRCLESMARGGFCNLFEDRVIFFQEICDEDIALAKKFGWRWEGAETNLGIQQGMKRLAESVRSDFVLHIENDCALVADPDRAAETLMRVHGDMAAGKMVACRLEKTSGPGVMEFYARKYRKYHAPRTGATGPQRIRTCLMRLLRPFKARMLRGCAIYYDDHPDEIFPDSIRKNNSGDGFITNSAFINWSNRPAVYDRAWFLNELIPYAEAHPRRRRVNGFPDLEKEANCRWWRRQNYPIGIITEGLFAHERLDRPAGDEKTKRQPA